MTEPETGVVVISRAGHDKGRAFVIIGRADTEHVFLADGVTRKLTCPKKKKLMHLRIEPYTAESVRSTLARNETLMDADVRKALATLGYNTERKQ
ncbi:MAG: KOW domain-containing RNA-binding protein [Clostridia bacterium]